VGTRDAAGTAPITGWTRERWGALADRMLLSLRPYASPHRARFDLPGPPAGYGADVSALEAFARSFLLAGFRLAGERGRDPHDLAGWYAAGLAAGTDPASDERWPRPDEHGQARVEAASLALILDLTRPWLWDRLDDGVRQRVVDYLATVVGNDDFPDNNWLWFRVVVEQFLRSVGGPWSCEDMERDLARHDDFVRPGGWYSDGPQRSYDHYAGWAMHLYPILWSRMTGAQELASPRVAAYTERLDRYLADAVHLVGADGSPLIQGRSLVYRFAAAAPFWVGALAEVPGTPPGVLRRAASGIVGHFVDHGAPDDRGLLTLGWHHEWRTMAQSYSATGSPYWAAKGMLGLALPADHPVWRAVEEPLPVETGDHLLRAEAPGWAISATAADGIVRVVNHGTDHADEGAATGDSPLYARLGYSTATAPPMDAAGWADPVDQSAVLLDGDGRATHRSGFRTLDARLNDGDTAAVLASRARAHWVEPDGGGRDVGSGRGGTARDAGTLTIVSVVRGPWEVRLVRADDVAADAVALRVGGWPVTGATVDVASGVARAGGIVSTLDAPRGLEAGCAVADDVTPLGPRTATPWVRVAPVPGSWVAVVVGLHGAAEPGERPRVSLADGTVRVTWPDGAVSEARLPGA
jgi:hypothetical protein